MQFIGSLLQWCGFPTNGVGLYGVAWNGCLNGVVPVDGCDRGDGDVLPSNISNIWCTKNKDIRNILVNPLLIWEMIWNIEKSKTFHLKFSLSCQTKRWNQERKTNSIHTYRSGCVDKWFVSLWVKLGVEVLSFYIYEKRKEEDKFDE